MNVTNLYAVASLLVVFLAAPLHNWALFYIAGLPIGRPDLLAVLVAFSAGMVSVMTHGRMRFVRVNVLTLALLGVAVGSSLYAVIWTTTLTAPIATMLIQVVVLILLLIVAPNLVWTTNDLLVVVRTWLYSAVVVSTFGIYQGIARTLSLPLAVLVFNVPTSGTVQRVGYEGSFGPLFRVAGVFPEPAWYGVYLVPPAVFCLSLLAYRPDSVVFGSRRVTVACGGILLIGILLSVSMLAYVTLLTTLVGFVVPVAVLRGNLRASHVSAAMVIAIPLTLLSSSLREGIGRVIRLAVEVAALIAAGDLRVAVGSAQYRLRIARTTIEVWSDGTPLQLLMGHGLNGLARNSEINYTAASSGYLQMLYDTGLIGTGLFIALIVGIGVITYRRSLVANCDNPSRILSISFTGAVIATGVQFLQIGYLFPVRWLGVLGALCYLSVTWPDRESVT